VVSDEKLFIHDKLLIMKRIITKSLAIVTFAISTIWFWVQQAIATPFSPSFPLSKLTPSPTIDPVKYQGGTNSIAVGGILLVVIIIGGVLVTVRRRK
jgi:hypothetical protein